MDDVEEERCAWKERGRGLECCMAGLESGFVESIIAAHHKECLYLHGIQPTINISAITMYLAIGLPTGSCSLSLQ